MKKFLLVVASCYFLTGLHAQNVAINNDGTTADPKALLDIKSTTKGVLFPRLSENDRLNMTGNIPLGLIVFQTDVDRGFYYNTSSLPASPNWKKLISGTDQYWFKNGVNLYNNTDITGNIGIGTTTPSRKFTVRTDGIGVTQENADGSAQIGFYTALGSAYLQTHTLTPLSFATNNNSTQMQLSTQGNLGIGTISPNLGGLVVDKKVGAVNAVFGSTDAGVALESDYPGVAFNSYYNGGRKALTAGYASLIGQNPTNGDLYLTTTSATAAAGATINPSTRLLITKDGNIGIQGNTAPQSPLSFANTLGEKINFYEVNANANYGVGVQGAQLQVYTGSSGDAISFGYGSSAAFTERVRMQNAYTIINNGRLQFKGSYGANSHGIEFTNNSGNASRSFIGMLDDNTMGFFGFPGAGWNFLWDVNDGSLRIGTTQKASGYMLNVGGKAIAEEVRVQLRAAWPDYVFKNNYRLMPLNELENYIVKNQHLPNIPKAAVLEKDGTDLGEMQRKMMEKIEELTLYVIELKKEINDLKNGSSETRKQ